MVDFDEEDLLDPRRLILNENFVIPYTGTLEPGFLENAMDVRNGQNAVVSKFKRTDQDVDKTCLGKLLEIFESHYRCLSLVYLFHYEIKKWEKMHHKRTVH